MRTKNLFYTLALSTVFVACSQEEIVESNNSAINDGRQMVGKVEIKPDFSGVDSRLTYDKGVPAFDNQDKIGAVLMDEWSKTAWPQFNLVDYLHTNYMYSTDDQGASWYSDAVMAEGNYFFYLPYNKDMRERGGAMYHVVSPNQKAEKDGKFNKYAALENQYFLGYKFITKEDGEQLPEEGLRMTAMHGSLGLKLKYTGSEPVTVKKIAVRKIQQSSKKEIDNERPLNSRNSLTPLTGIAGALVNGIIEYEPMVTRVDVKPATTHEGPGFLDRLCLASNEYKLKRNKDGEITTPAMAEDYDALMYTLIYPNYETGLTYQYELSFPKCEDAKLSNGENVSAFMLMPFQNFWYSSEMEDFDAYGEPAGMVLAVYTDKGIFEVPMWMDNADLSKVISNVTVLSSMEALRADKVGYFTVEFGQEAAYNKPKTFTVNNSTDLYEHLALYEENKKEAVTLHLYTASEDVKMTKEIYDFLAGHRNIKLTLESGKIVIPAGLTTTKEEVSPIDLVYLSESYNYDSEEILYEALKKRDFDVPAPVIVLEEGASYATSGLNYTSTSGMTLASFVKNKLAEEAPNFGISTFNNIAIPAIVVEKGATLDIYGSVKARIINAGTTNTREELAVLGVANTGTFNVKDNFFSFNVYNGPTAKLNIAKNVEARFALFNDRDIKAEEDNCCLFESNFAFQWGTVTIKEGAKVHLYGLGFQCENENLNWFYGNWGKIVNKGAIYSCYSSNTEIDEEREVKYLINHGWIVNEGVIYDLINDGYVDNNGKLYLSETTQWSYVDVTDSQIVELPNEGKDNADAIYAYQVSKETESNTIKAWVNKVIVSSKLTVNANRNVVEYLILKDGAEVVGTGDTNAYGFTNNDLRTVVLGTVSMSNTRAYGKLTVVEGATLNNSSKTVYNDIIVKDGGEFIVITGGKMTCRGTFENYGHVEVEPNAEADMTNATYLGTGDWAGNNDPR